MRSTRGELRYYSDDSVMSYEDTLFYNFLDKLTLGTVAVLLVLVGVLIGLAT